MEHLTRENIEIGLMAVFTIIGGFSTLARITPWPHDDHAIAWLTNKLKWVCDLLGMNHGRTANKD